MKKYITAVSLAVLTHFISSCASTPQTRIEQNPGLFSKLTTDDQSLVEQGRIRKGMHKDGVRLAMGNPERISYGASSNGDYEQWNYYTLSPVMTHHMGGYWGGWGRGFGCGRYRGFGYSPSITYIPRQSAVVKFSGDRVSSYEARR